MAVGLSLAGAAGCAMIGWQVYTHDSITKMTNGILLTFEVTPQIIGVGMAVAAALGLLACIAPAIAVARLSAEQAGHAILVIGAKARLLNRAAR